MAQRTGEQEAEESQRLPHKGMGSRHYQERPKSLQKCQHHYQACAQTPTTTVTSATGWEKGKNNLLKGQSEIFQSLFSSVWGHT